MVPVKNLPLLLNLAYAGLNNQDFRPRGGKTFCNEFIQSVCNGFGYVALNGMNANQIVAFLSNPVNGWISPDDTVAQAHANVGVLVIAGWANASGHGHVNLIVPGILEKSNSAGKAVPKCCNVGADVFMGKRLSYAFAYPNERPAFFALAGMI